jgi:hypothetical protein
LTCTGPLPAAPSVPIRPTSYELSMKAGDLIQYNPETGGSFFGIITKDPGIYLEYNKDAVEIYWQDDGSYTFEHVEVILDPEKEWLELISESR